MWQLSHRRETVVKKKNCISFCYIKKMICMAVFAEVGVL